MEAYSKRLAPIVVTGALAGLLAGCSSSPPPAPAQRPGTVSSGTATVSIDGRDAGADAMVSCQTIGTVTTVNTGDEEAGSSVVISSDPDLVVRTVSIRNLGGFTGSYNDGLGDSAKIAVKDRTYEVSGVADGFDTVNPSFRKQGEFTILLAC